MFFEESLKLKDKMEKMINMFDCCEIFGSRSKTSPARRTIKEFQNLNIFPCFEYACIRTNLLVE